MCQDWSELLYSKNIDSPKNLNDLDQPWQSLVVGSIGHDGWRNVQ